MLAEPRDIVMSVSLHMCSMLADAEARKSLIALVSALDNTFQYSVTLLFHHVVHSDICSHG